MFNDNPNDIPARRNSVINIRQSKLQTNTNESGQHTILLRKHPKQHNRKQSTHWFIQIL